MSKLEELRARQQELVEINQEIMATADAESRELSEDEQDKIDSNTSEWERIKGDIDRRETIMAQAAEANKSAGRRADPEPVRSRLPADDDDDVPARPKAQAKGSGQQPARVYAEPRARDSGQWGFRSFGEFAMSVRRGSISGGEVDPRLVVGMRNAATSYGNESVGEQGGFLVPPDFRTQIMEKVLGEDSLLARTDGMTSGSNNFTFPADETTPWQTSGGVQAYWEGEGGTITQSRPSLQQKSLRLNKLTALVPVTEELLEDAPAIDGYLRRKAPQKMIARINTAIIRGSGVGQPLGILNSPALVSVAQESGPQTADTVVFANIVKMWSRMYAPCRQNAVWIINQDVEQQMMTMTAPGTNPSTPVYIPPGGLSAAPYGMLLGRPIVPVEAASALGDKGDIMLVDLTQYLTVTRASGVRIDTSIHLYFDQDMTAFRFVFRVGGMPWWASSITRQNGSNTLSCFVVLDDRTGS